MAAGSVLSASGMADPLSTHTQVGIRSINKEGREQAKRFGVEQFEMRHFSKDRELLESLV